MSVWGTGTRPALLCEQTELLCPGRRAEEEVSTTGKRREQDGQGGYAPPLWYCWRFNRPVRPAELLLRRPSKTAAGRTAVRASGHVQAPDDDDDDDPETSVWQLDSSTWPLVPDHFQVRPTGLGLELSRQERLELTSCPRPPALSSLRATHSPPPAPPRAARDARPRLDLAREYVLSGLGQASTHAGLTRVLSFPATRRHRPLAEVLHADGRPARGVARLAAQRARPRRLHRGQARRRQRQHRPGRHPGERSRGLGERRLEDGVGQGERPRPHLRRTSSSARCPVLGSRLTFRTPISPPGCLPPPAAAALHPSAPLLAQGSLPLALHAGDPHACRRAPVDLGRGQLGRSPGAQPRARGLGQGLGEAAQARRERVGRCARRRQDASRQRAS